MAPRRKDPRPGHWQYTIGEPPLQLTAYERADRGLAIYTRVWDGRRYTTKQALRGPIRDARGRVIPEEEIAAQRATVDRHRALLAGLDATPAGPLTLAEGFRRLLHAKEGKFASDSQWKGDVARASKIIKGILGADLLCADIRALHYRKLWRALADQHVERGAFGPRMAEIIVGVLRSTVVWLQQEGYLEAGTGLPAQRWKTIMRTEWEEIVRRPVPQPAKPRYTPEEWSKLWAALPQADPRLALALEIGAELRLGQVPRSRRSDVIPHGGFRVGAVRVHGRGKKRGALVVLTMAQRHALVREMLRGVLADCERAYWAGEIADYCLIPGGKLRTVDGIRRVPIERAGESWGRTGLRKAWRQLEVLAGVEHQRGRNWYGGRRLAADLAEDVTSDARALNTLGGWTHTATREGYQEQGRADIAEKAKAVRAQIRPKVRPSKDIRAYPESGR